MFDIIIIKFKYFIYVFNKNSLIYKVFDNIKRLTNIKKFSLLSIF